MQLHGIDYAFWLAAFAGHLLLIAGLFVRRRAKSFPVFTAWLVSNVVRTVVLYYVFRHLGRNPYFYVYWSMAIVDISLQIGVFFELARKVFRPAGTWARDARAGFGLVVGVSCSAALLLSWWAAPVATRPLQSIALKGDFFSSALLSELFVGMMVLSSWVGLPWKTHEARIAQGLGVYSAIGLITEGAHTLQSSQNLAVYKFWSHVEITCYLLCLSYWIVTLWQNAPEPRELPEKLRIELAALNRMLEGDLVRVTAWRKP